MLSRMLTRIKSHLRQSGNRYLRLALLMVAPAIASISEIAVIWGYLHLGFWLATALALLPIGLATGSIALLYAGVRAIRELKQERMIGARTISAAPRAFNTASDLFAASAAHGLTLLLVGSAFAFLFPDGVFTHPGPMFIGITAVALCLGLAELFEAIATARVHRDRAFTRRARWKVLSALLMGVFVPVWYFSRTLGHPLRLALLLILASQLLSTWKRSESFTTPSP